MFLPNRRRLWIRLLFMVGAVVLFTLGYQWGNRYQRRHAELPTIGGVLVRPPGVVPGFRLADPLGRIFDRHTLAKGWTLIAFGDPARASGQLAVQRLVDIYNRVSDRESLHRSLRLVLATDPPTPDPTLARQLAALSPALYVLGGDSAESQRLASALGAAGGGAATLYVFAPGGYLVALLTEDQDGAAAASDLAALYAHADLLLPETP